MSKKPGGAGLRWQRYLAIILVLLVLYPLSVGPYMWLSVNNYLPNALDDPYKAGFGPIVWLHHNNRTAEQFLDWYTQLWSPGWVL
jgi:hypothetical protein